MLPRLLPATFMLLSLSLSACGEQPTLEEKKQEEIQQWSGDTSFADQYFLDDLACQGSEGAVTVGSSSVRFFQFGESTEQTFDFSSFGSFNGISGPGIKTTYYDLAQTERCSVDDNDDSCGDATVTSGAKKLNVCRANGSYPRLSVEGIALTSIANLSRAFAYYQKVPGQTPKLLAGNVLVLPKVEKIFPAGAEIETDNLAYTASFDGAPGFIIYPKSASAVKAGRWVDVNLWEAPWGLAHEFGHHVFRTHTGFSGMSEALAALFEVSHPIHSIVDESVDESVDERAASKGLALQSYRTVAASDHWSAINEGFADLFAFYTFGARPGLAKGLDCFDQNREVTAGTFTMGVKKHLDLNAMSAFLSPVADGGSTCSAPSLQDSHTIGAIVAHGVDALFSVKVGGTEGEEAALRKSELLLLWANTMGETVNAGGKVTVARLVQDALAVVATGNVLTNAACDVVREKFPAFADVWLTESFTCQ